MNINGIIAENLTKLRLERNLSMGQLAKLCNVSKVMLSQIEKGVANPTINTLWKIANGLKIPYTVLLDKEKNDTTVITKADTQMQSDESKSYNIYSYYSNTPNRNFELFQMELDCDSSYKSIGHYAKTEEYIMVISGILQLEINGDIFILNPNDAISFDASNQHIYSSVGNSKLLAMVINYYPV